MIVLEFTQSDVIGFKEMAISDIASWKKSIEQNKKIIQDSETSLIIDKGRVEMLLRSGNLEASEALLSKYIPTTKMLIESLEKCNADCERAITDAVQRIKGYDRATASGKLPLNYSTN